MAILNGPVATTAAMPTQAIGNFNAIDANGDGVITRAEFNAAMAGRASQLGTTMAMPTAVAAAPATVAAMPSYASGTPYVGAASRATYVGSAPTYGGVKTVAPAATYAAPAAAYASAAPVYTAAAPSYTAAPRNTPSYVPPVQAPRPSQAAPIQYSAPPAAAPVQAQAPVLPALPAMPAMPQLAQPQTNHDFNPGQPPEMPGRLTDGVPDPIAIEQQKAQYARSLDEQLAQAIATLEERNKEQKIANRRAADQQKMQYAQQVDAHLRQQEMNTEQEANYQLMGLQQAAHEQKAMLEQQANHAVLEYQQKKVQDDFAMQQYEYQRKAAEKQLEIQRELQMEMERHHNDLVPEQQEQRNSVAGGGPMTYGAPVMPNGGAAPSANGNSYVPPAIEPAAAAPTGLMGPSTSYGPAPGGFGLPGGGSIYQPVASSYVPPAASYAPASPGGYGAPGTTYAMPNAGSSYALPPPPPQQLSSTYSAYASAVEQANSVFDQLDKNHDGVVSRAEFAQAMNTMQNSGALGTTSAFPSTLPSGGSAYMPAYGAPPTQYGAPPTAYGSPQTSYQLY
eukprot:TRINITY_DN22730_c1_g3_i1.p1 TRINITY_DN22730_c1_g3~~TRINITY_DN22730_c1_g3_i1.p1  ORF type:complete len:580 (+),score=141.80 TRINITY_DN22730_c1_g3_i1:51-1742(+)